MRLKELFSIKTVQPQRTESELRMHRCAFTGHRSARLYGLEGDVIVSLHNEILAAIEDGYTTFITGCSTGVDLWAADIVLELRRQNKALKLICAVPFEGFDSNWSVDWVKHYKMVRKQADWVEVISPNYSPEVYQKRNIWMCRHSSRLIAVWDGLPSGTQNTIDYAREIGLSINVIEVQK